MGTERFWGDNRGVSVVIGAILIFGIVIMSLASYQAFVVPVDNAEVEFDHFERATADMLEVRNTIMTTKVTGQDGFVTVELGTQLPQRMLAVNPPNPTGTLETSDLRDIRVYDPDDEDEEAIAESTEDTCGVDDATRLLSYTPNYREFDGAGTIRYENSVVYTEFDGGTFITHSGQELLRGSLVTIIPLTSSFYAEGHEPVSFEPRPGRLLTRTMSDPIIELPTALDEQTWHELLGDELDSGESATVFDNGTLRLELSGTYTVRCEPVGIDEFPEGGGRAPETRDINPVGEGTIQLIHQELDGDTVRLTFRNRGEDASVEEARINFATSHEGGVSPDYADIYAPGEQEPSGRLVTGGDWVDLDPEIELEGVDEHGEGEETTVIEMEWNDMSDNSWYVLSFLYDTGDEANYFVGFAQQSPTLLIGEIRSTSDDEVFAGETATVEVLVLNTGAPGEADVELIRDGAVEDTVTVDLDAGERTDVVLQYESQEGDVEDSPIELEVRTEVDWEVHDLEVLQRPDDPYYSIHVSEYDDTLFIGQEHDFDLEITNVGLETGGEQLVELVVDGETKTSETVGPLDPDESTTVTLSWMPTESDENIDTVEFRTANDTETRPVEVREMEMADRVQLLNADGTGDGRVTFDLEETTGDSDLVLTGIRIDFTDQDVTYVDNADDPEFVGAGGEINIPGQIDIGVDDATDLTTAATISAGETEGFELAHFEDNTNMNNQEVRMTFFFDDGSSTTITFQT